MTGTAMSCAMAWIFLAPGADGAASAPPVPGTHRYTVMPPPPHLPQREALLRDLLARAVRLPRGAKPPGSMASTPFSLLGDPLRGPVLDPPHPPFQGKSRLIALMGDFPSGNNRTYGMVPAGTPYPYPNGAADHFQRQIFGSVSPYGDPWTVRNYYYDASYGILELDGDVYGPYTVSQPYSYYTQANYGFGTYPTNAAGFAVEVIHLHNQANPGFDWTRYDADQNGVVDGLFVLHPGGGAESGAGVNAFWSHFWGLQDAGVPNAPLPVGSGEAIDPYSCDPEHEGAFLDRTVGVYAHEVMHNFGMTDTYNRLYTCDGGTGDWSSQAAGSWSGNPPGSRPCLMDPWNAALMGWLAPTVPAGDLPGAVLSMRESAAGANGFPLCYKLWTNGEAEGEYFLVENRRQVGWDQYVPGNGVLVWHIDEAYFLFGVWNDDCGHPYNAVSEADAGFNRDSPAASSWLKAAAGFNMRTAMGTSGANAGDAGDPFPGTRANNRFADETWPSSRSYYGSPSYVVVENFETFGTDVQMDIAVAGPRKYRGYRPGDPFRLWPNPFEFNRAKDHAIRFGPLPKGSWMNVFSVTGERVATVVAQEEGIQLWRNPPLARGVYAYVATSVRGGSFRGVFAVVP